MRKNRLSRLLAALFAALLLVPMISSAEDEIEAAPRAEDTAIVVTIPAPESNVKEAEKTPVVEAVKALEKAPAAEPAKEAEKAPAAEPAKEAEKTPAAEPVKAPENAPAAEPAKDAEKAPAADAAKEPEEPQKQTEPETSAASQSQPTVESEPTIQAPAQAEMQSGETGDRFDEDEPLSDAQTQVVRVRFLTERGTVSYSSAEYVVGKPYGRLPVVTLAEEEGYEFIGWADHGAAVSSSTVVTRSEAYSLHALFREIQPAEQTGEQDATPAGNAEDVPAPDDVEKDDAAELGDAPASGEEDVSGQNPVTEGSGEANSDAEPDQKAEADKEPEADKGAEPEKEPEADKESEPNEETEADKEAEADKEPEPDQDAKPEENDGTQTDAGEGSAESGAEAEKDGSGEEPTAPGTAEENPAEGNGEDQADAAEDEAQTEAKYRITYHIIGAVGQAPATAEISAAELEAGYALEQPAPVEHYAFKGWYLDEGMTGSPVMRLTEAKDAELYGVFLIDHYSVTYDANAGKDTVTGMPDPLVEFHACGETVSVSEAVPKRDGYLFGGWSAEGALFGEGKNSFVMPEQNVTLRAVWKPGTFVVSYVDDDGNKLLKDRSVTGGSKLPLPGYEIVKKGKIVVGWLDEAGREVSASQIVTEDMALTAIWEKAYTVTYQDGLKYVEVFKPQSYTAAAGSKTPEFWGKPYRKGYKFIGWRADGERGLGLYRRVNRDVTYYAVWERVGGKGDVPKTGDTSGNGLLYAGFTFLTLAACCGYVRRKK